MSDAPFFVPGIPQPQGSARAFVNRRTMRAIVTSDNPKLKGWRDVVAKAARKAWGSQPMLKGPIKLAISFRLKAPQKQVRLYPTVRPDLDKLVRAIGDALIGIVYADDSQIAELAALKTYARQDQVGVVIQVKEIDDLVDKETALPS